VRLLLLIVISLCVQGCMFDRATHTTVHRAYKGSTAKVGRVVNCLTKTVAPVPAKDSKLAVESW
jgi:hypothetical protein